MKESRQSFSSYEDANDNNSTDCPDQNCDALSPLPETAENGDLGEDDPDSRSDNEAAQKFPSMKSVFEDNANYHEDRIMLDNANGTENACPASSVDPSKLRETTSEKDGSDKSVSLKIFLLPNLLRLMRLLKMMRMMKRIKLRHKLMIRE